MPLSRCSGSVSIRPITPTSMMPCAARAGQATRVPEPTTALIVPAHTPATNTMIACHQLMILQLKESTGRGGRSPAPYTTGQRLVIVRIQAQVLENRRHTHIQPG